MVNLQIINQHVAAYNEILLTSRIHEKGNYCQLSLMNDMDRILFKMVLCFVNTCYYNVTNNSNITY